MNHISCSRVADGRAAAFGAKRPGGFCQQVVTEFVSLLQVYTGGIDNTIKVWDLRKEEVSLTLEGHGDTVTGMRAPFVPFVALCRANCWRLC